MPGGAQLEAAVSGDNRLDAANLLREAGPRLDDVELRRDVERPPQIVRPAAERVGEREQDAPDFLGFLLLQRDDVVVDLDGLQRLDEQARAGGRPAVDDARN